MAAKRATTLRMLFTGILSMSLGGWGCGLLCRSDPSSCDGNVAVNSECTGSDKFAISPADKETTREDCDALAERSGSPKVCVLATEARCVDADEIPCDYNWGPSRCHPDDPGLVSTCTGSLLRSTRCPDGDQRQCLEGVCVDSPPRACLGRGVDRCEGTRIVSCVQAANGSLYEYSLPCTEQCVSDPVSGAPTCLEDLP